MKLGEVEARFVPEAEVEPIDTVRMGQIRNVEFAEAVEVALFNYTSTYILRYNGNELHISLEDLLIEAAVKLVEKSRNLH